MRTSIVCSCHSMHRLSNTVAATAEAVSDIGSVQFQSSISKDYQPVSELEKYSSALSAAPIQAASDHRRAGRERLPHSTCKAAVCAGQDMRSLRGLQQLQLMLYYMLVLVHDTDYYFLQCIFHSTVIVWSICAPCLCPLAVEHYQVVEERLLHPDTWSF